MKICIICLLSFLSLTLFLNARNVPMMGHWQDRKLRSVEAVHVEQEGNTLSVSVGAPLSDTTVRLIDKSGKVYEYDYSADQSAFIVISLDALDSGRYTLELTNRLGGYLLGEIEL